MPYCLGAALDGRLQTAVCQAGIVRCACQHAVGLTPRADSVFNYCPAERVAVAKEPAGSQGMEQRGDIGLHPQSTKGGFGGGGSVRRNSFGEGRASAPSAAKRFAKVTPQEFAARRWMDAFQVNARRTGGPAHAQWNCNISGCLPRSCSGKHPDHDKQTSSGQGSAKACAGVVGCL